MDVAGTLEFDRNPEGAPLTLLLQLEKALYEYLHHTSQFPLLMRIRLSSAMWDAGVRGAFRWSRTRAILPQLPVTDVSTHIIYTMLILS
jgi:hypothetical protein